MGKSDWFACDDARGKEKVVLFVCSLIFLFVFACTKDVGINPALAYSDKALLDSCKQNNLHYYQNSQAMIPSTGPHGPHQLRFNHIAWRALGNDGKLALGKTMPEGSMIIKDVYQNGSINLYAFIYKHSGSWLWGEISPQGNIQYSVYNNVSICTNCHSGSGNRDYILSFN